MLVPYFPKGVKKHGKDHMILMDFDSIEGYFYCLAHIKDAVKSNRAQCIDRLVIRTTTDNFAISMSEEKQDGSM